RARDRGRARDGKMISALLFVLAALEVDPMGQYLADLEKAGVLREDNQPASLDRIRETLVAAEDALVTGNPQVGTTGRFRIVDARVAGVHLVLVRARVSERRVHAGALAGARGRVRVGRTLPLARARARAQGHLLRARLPGDGRRRAGDARAGGGAGAAGRGQGG